MACWLLTGCMQSSIVLQLYDAGDANKATVIEEIENFESESAMQVQWPEVTPAASHAEVTVVHGSDWQTASLAWNLADRLRGLGVSVVVKSSRLQNHVVRGRHIGVFVGKSQGATESDGFGDQISQLVCYTPDGDEARGVCKELDHRTDNGSEAHPRFDSPDYVSIDTQALFLVVSSTRIRRPLHEEYCLR